MPDISDVLFTDQEYVGAEWSLDGDPTSKEEFDTNFTLFDLKGKKKPVWDDLKEKLKVMQAEYDALAYARSRKEEYDKLNQFELMYDDQQNSTDNWAKEIQAIKAKYPKK